MRQQLKHWDTAALLGLVKNLYETSAENRDFLEARIRAHEGGGEALAAYRQRIVEQFFPARGFGELKLGEARRAIREYRKATGNIEGVIELLTTYLENGNEFTCQFGDIDERFYDTAANLSFWLRRASACLHALLARLLFAFGLRVLFARPFSQTGF